MLNLTDIRNCLGESIDGEETEQVALLREIFEEVGCGASIESLIGSVIELKQRFWAKTSLLLLHCSNPRRAWSVIFYC